MDREYVSVIFVCYVLDLLEEYTSSGMFDGIYYTVTDKSDHPAFKLLEEPKIVQPTQHHWLSLETKVVK